MTSKGSLLCLYVTREISCSLNLGWLRQSIAVVEQTPTLLSGSIYDNIHLGNPQASFEDVVNAAEMVWWRPL
jgi:ATP-binding cassette subfamily B protein AbcA/BmrA